MTGFFANLHAFIRNAFTICRFYNAKNLPGHENMPFGGQVEGPSTL